MNIELPNGHAKLNGRNYTHPSWQGALRVWGRRYKETQSNGRVEATNHNYELKSVSGNIAIGGQDDRSRS
jgi:hypothetical protein